MKIKQNSDFLFAFEASMTNPNGDPDQENKPRMDYETKTALVSDARRKRDIRNFLKAKGLPVFVDTLREQKVPMEDMLAYYRDMWLSDEDKMRKLLQENETLLSVWDKLADASKKTTFREIYEDKNAQKLKKEFVRFNNLFTTELIQRELIDIRLFGSAMAVDNVSRTFTGPIQISWGYSLHPVELVKSNTITSIMNDDNSTFGKKHKLHYGLFMHSGTINKYNARLTNMTEQDRQWFRSALVQGMMMNQTDSKQGQTPLFYLEVQYTPDFDGFLGDMRRFVKTKYDPDRPIRSLQDLSLDDSGLVEALNQMKSSGYVDRILAWYHPVFQVDKMLGLQADETLDLWAPLENAGIAK